MIESTPQLFGNAWRVSSACVSGLIPPQLDPCDTHQQAGQFVSVNLYSQDAERVSGGFIVTFSALNIHCDAIISSC